MVKKRLKNSKELEVPIWFLDGFVGVLALLIYNFALYILNLIGTGEIVSQLESTTGYFMLNSFVDFGYTASQMALGIILVFIFCYILGIIIGNLVRKRRGKK